MSEEHRKRRSWLWLLVLLALVLVYWLWRPAADNGVSAAQEAEDRAQAAGLLDPDDLLVDFVDSVSSDQVAAIGRDLGVQFELVSQQSNDERFYRVHVPANQRDGLLATLAQRSDVEFAEADGVYALSPQEAQAVAQANTQWQGFPNDPLYEAQWHLRQIKMPEAWKLADGEGVIVAVLDTGVAFENYGNMHLVPDLAGVRMVKPYNFVDDNEHAGDDHGHGTHVAGTIAQATHNGVGVAGVGRNVSIMPLKVLSGSGSGSVGGIADAIRYAADEGAHVINMSLGGPFPSRALRDAVAYAHKKGVVVVCAAGNETRNRASYPAAYPGAIAVSSTTEDEKVAFYSNYGRNLDIAAPGGDTREGPAGGVLQNTITISDPRGDGYFAFMGTSMASPHAAGVAALIVGEGITQPDAVEKILKDTARAPSGQKMDPTKYGAGIIDAEAAVLAARSKSGAWQTVIALLLGAAVLASARRGLWGPGVGLRYWGASALAAGGMFFLPWLSASLSSSCGVEFATRGLPSWDMGILGFSGHGNALFFSALLPLILVGLLSGVERLRPLLAGLCVGVAGHLLFFVAAPLADIRYVPNFWSLDALWLVANAAVCTWLAVNLLRRQTISA